MHHGECFTTPEKHCLSKVECRKNTRPGWWWEFHLSLVTHWSFAL
jgi:hypothetical protein